MTIFFSKIGVFGFSCISFSLMEVELDRFVGVDCAVDSFGIFYNASGPIVIKVVRGDVRVIKMIAGYGQPRNKMSQIAWHGKLRLTQCQDSIGKCIVSIILFFIFFKYT